MKKKNIVLVATLDTKGREARFVKNIIQRRGHNVIVLDTGLLGRPLFKADISRERVALAGGKPIEEMKQAPSRAVSNHIMGEGAARIVKRLYEQRKTEKKIDGIIGIGGAQGTAIGTRAMRELPIGIPKLMISTIASGNMRPYVDICDITVMHSVIDIAGLNFISRKILRNGANAVCGMAESHGKGLMQRFRQRFKQTFNAKKTQKKRIAISMYGTTTPCVMKAAEILENAGFETVTFHASGMGGKAMEEFVRQRMFDGVLDVTIAELTNFVMEGDHSAGASRLEAAGKAGIPQIVIPGAANFFVKGPLEMIPRIYLKRNHVAHSTKMTLFQVNDKELAMIGNLIAEKLNKSKGKAMFIVPKKSFSFYSEEGQLFWSPTQHRLLADTVRSGLKPHVIYKEYNLNINDPEFAEKITDEMMSVFSQ